jgi:hypothetical protein
MYIYIYIYIYTFNLKGSSRIYRYRSYYVNPCYPHSLGLPPSTVALTSTVASSTVAPIHILSSTVTPTITEASRSTVASPRTMALSTMAPTNIIISTTVALISTVTLSSTEDTATRATLLNAAPTALTLTSPAYLEPLPSPLSSMPPLPAPSSHFQAPRQDVERSIPFFDKSPPPEVADTHRGIPASEAPTPSAARGLRLAIRPRPGARWTEATARANSSAS